MDVVEKARFALEANLGLEETRDVLQDLLVEYEKAIEDKKLLAEAVSDLASQIVELTKGE